MNINELIKYFDYQIQDIIKYSLENNIMVGIPHLIDMRNKIGFLNNNSSLDVIKILQCGYRYLQVVEKGTEEDSIKYEEKFRTILDIYYSLEKYIKEQISK